MSVHHVSSQQLMSVLSDAENRIQTLEKSSAILNSNVNRRLLVIRNIQEYELAQMTDLLQYIKENTEVLDNTKIVLARADIVAGVYDKFGSTLHPQLLKTPSNVFNFRTPSGYAFKNNAVVTVNDEVKSQYTAMLEHDTIQGQDIFFEEFTTPNITINVKVNPGELLGTTAFNLLELVPFIPGSFDIRACEIFSLQGYYTSDTVPDSSFPNVIQNVGVSRFLIDQTINLYELRLNISLNFRNSNGKYPFGIKHLYFLNANFNPDSYVVVRVRKNNYIDTVSENLTVTDQSGIVDSSCKAEDITLYCDWTNGIGVNEIVTSKGLTNNPVVYNTKSFYVHYPIVRSVTALQFNSVITR